MMRTKSKLIRVLLPVTVCVWAAAVAFLAFQPGGERAARAVGDEEVGGAMSTPNVLLLSDMSANMNSNMGTTKNDPTLGCYSGPVKKYMAFQMVLTGRLAGGDVSDLWSVKSVCGDGTCNGTESCVTCAADCGACSGCTAGGPDSSGRLWTDADSPNLIYKYQDKMRFAMSGLDQKAGTGTDSAGGYSYPKGIDLTATAKYTWDGFNIVGAPISPTVVNQGMVHADAPVTDFKLLAHYRSSDMEADNLALVPEIMSTTFGSNTDGLMDMFDDAYYYWKEDFPVRAGDDAPCGDKYIIYLMGGEPGPGYADAEQMVQKLYSELGVVTYVVGLVDDNTPDSKRQSIYRYADKLAKAGGGLCANDPEVFGPGYEHCAFIAHGGNAADVAGVNGLATQLGTVMAIIMNQVSSRTAVAVSDTPLLATVDGQWRVNAYFQVMQAGGAWRGFLKATQILIDGDSGASTMGKTLDFDAKLQDRVYSTRDIFTRDDSGNKMALSTALATYYSDWVAGKYSTFGSEPCLADAFFKTVTVWSDMVYGYVPPSLPASCAGRESETAYVNVYTGHKLGDIYHSSPVVVGPPALYLNEPSYLSFMLDKQDRPTMIYVGANDGMLHAFYLRNDDPTLVGEEAWAYVPRSVVGRLDERIKGGAQLVDATVIVRDIQSARDSSAAASWKTVLVGGLGRGGARYYGLDVTDPANPVPLGEFPAYGETDADLGLTIPTPAIGRVFIDKTKDGSTYKSERPVVFLSGGWQAGDDTVGRAFYVIDLEDGSLLKKFSWATVTDLTAPITGSPTAYEDLPTTFTTRVFVGDKRGRMWRVDVSSPDTSKWSMKLFYPQADWTSEQAGRVQPIFLAPSVAVDFARRPIVFYGTGDITHLTKTGETAQPNWFYGVRENIDFSGASPVVTPELIYTPPIGDEPGYGFPIELIDRDNNKQETLTGEPVIFNGVVLFTTFVETGRCGFGEGRLYGIDYLTGKPRLSSKGQLTYAGDESARNFISLGPGVPSAPLIRQLPAQVAISATGEATVTGGQYQAIIQSGAGERTEDITDRTHEIGLGSLSRRADILTVVEVE